MYQCTPGGVRFKIFVKETDPSDQHKDIKTTQKYFPVIPLTGDSAKEFYEDILKQPSSTKEKKNFVKPKPNVKPPPERKKFKNNDLLRMAQNNDLKNLNKFFEQTGDYDLNIVDNFGWTPLMCASCNGAEEAVVLLLKNGADPLKCDRLGNTALKLARQNNHTKIVEKLQNYNSKPEITEYENLEKTTEPFFCPICKENFTMSKTKHESSTLHLFNCQLKTSTYYAIPECNKGFQLLLREGWDKEKGLGPDGTGRKFPVKAVMKKDRLGIGAPPPPLKNKHKSQNTENKERKIFNRWKEKDFEKNFRLEFS